MYITGPSVYKTDVFLSPSEEIAGDFRCDDGNFSNSVFFLTIFLTPPFSDGLRLQATCSLITFFSVTPQHPKLMVNADYFMRLDVVLCYPVTKSYALTL